MKLVRILTFALLYATCTAYGAGKSVAKKATTKKIPAAAAKIQMIYIPAGKFLMGNSGIEPDARYAPYYPQELPQHSVTLDNYSIGKYEVTRAEYRAFMNDGGYANRGYWSAAGWGWKLKTRRAEPQWWAVKQDWAKSYDTSMPFSQTDRHPVLGVSYYEAEAFCKWAGGHLPTDAQWEKAARWTGTHSNVYPWGDVADAQKCNNLWDTNLAGGGRRHFQTAPVGSYRTDASPYGCLDMAGNISEWCRDWYGVNYYSKSSARNPQGPASGSFRVIRGGSWRDGDCENGTRCAVRTGCYSSDDFCDTGFRLAR